MYAIKRGLIQRRACTLLSVSRSSLTYLSRMAVKDEAVIQVMQKLSGQYSRFSYRRIKILLSWARLSMLILIVHYSYLRITPGEMTL